MPIETVSTSALNYDNAEEERSSSVSPSTASSNRSYSESDDDLAKIEDQLRQREANGESQDHFIRLRLHIAL